MGDELEMESISSALFDPIGDIGDNTLEVV